MDRAGDSDREGAVRALREHFVRGRLTLEEFSERAELALRARSRRELRQAFGELSQPTGQSVVNVLVRGAALVVFTGAWLVFSFALLLIFALTLLIHGATAPEFGGFLLVWIVPTYLLSRLWRKRPHGHVK